MSDLVMLLVHLIATAKLLLPGGARAVVAESLLLKYQLLILNRSRARAPNLRSIDRVIAGLCAGLMAAVEHAEHGFLCRGPAGSAGEVRPTGDLQHRSGLPVHQRSEGTRHQEVYLHAYDTASAARASLTRYIQFYNTRRPHTALDRRTPDAVYFESLPLAQAA